MARKRDVASTPTSAGQKRPGGLHVGFNLSYQGVHRIELALLAETIDELQAKLASVEVGRESEKMRLDNLASAVEGGANTNVDDRRVPTNSNHRKGGIHPAGREDQTGLDVEIGGWKSDARPPVITSHHPAGPGEGSSQELAGRGDIAIGQKAADEG